MDLDFELILYIIFVVVAILSRVLKKKTPPPPSSSSEEEVDQGPTVTFEDLLKEFQGKRSPEPEKKMVEEKVPEPVQEYEFEDKYPSELEIQEVFEKSVHQAQRAKLMDQDPVERDKMEHFAAFEKKVEENKMASEIREMLTNPDSAAKAIVLGEIINRKY